MFGFWACVMLLAFLPAAFFRTMLGIGSIWGAVLFVLLLFLGFGLTELVLLLLQKRRFNRQIEAYNQELEEHASDLPQNISLYTGFVSHMVSYARGNSYLYILKQVDSFGRPDNSLEIDTEGFTRKAEIPSTTDIFLERKRENHKKGQREAQLQREKAGNTGDPAG